MADVQLGLLASQTLLLASPLALAAMGGLLSERSGVMNIGLEGKMIGGACATAFVAVVSGSLAWGVAAGIGVAVLLSLVHVGLVSAFRLDHIVSGMAINALALGGTSFVAERMNRLGVTDSMPAAPIPVFLVVGMGVPLALAWALRATRPGIHLLAVGNDPDKSRQMGLSPERVRLFALVLTGVLCGLAGALIASSAGRFVDGMTAGRGFIALAAMILGGWRPVPALLASLAFGGFEALQLQLQGTALFGAQLPPEAWNALPYTVTLLALALMWGKGRAPAGLGKP